MAREKQIRPDMDRDSILGTNQTTGDLQSAGGDPRAAAHQSDLQFAELGAVQLAGGGGTSPDQVKAAAASGVQGGGSQLPHLEAIQGSFGPAHDLSGVRAHVGGAAAEASAQMGAHAFTSGEDIGFKEAPSLHLAAHEAAHVVQQQQGVQLAGGVGQSGDAYERNADAVADRVVRGESAADLLPAQGGAAGAAGVQLYEDAQVGGRVFRVSDTGKSMVSQDGGAGGQTLYATDDLVGQANAKLATAGKDGSFISLKKTSATIDHDGKTLAKVEPVLTARGDDPKNQRLTDANSGGKDDDGTKSTTMALWAQCGRSSKAVMGTDDHGESARAHIHSGGTEYVTSRSGNPATFSNQIYLFTIPRFIADPDNDKYLVDGVHYDGDKKNKIAPQSPTQARAMYWELGEEGRDKFDRETGVNTGADPEIGGAYTMATEYDMPGYAEVNPDFTWNFHWAGVVMKDGSDNVSLENYAIMFPRTGDPVKDEENAQRAYDWVNRDWVYQMYGTVKKEQTFHEQHLDTGTHGTRASTFAAKV